MRQCQGHRGKSHDGRGCVHLCAGGGLSGALESDHHDDLGFALDRLRVALKLLSSAEVCLAAREGRERRAGTHVKRRRGRIARVDEPDQLVKDGLLDHLLGLGSLHGVRILSASLLRLELFELREDGGLDAFAAAFHEEDVDVGFEQGRAD